MIKLVKPVWNKINTADGRVLKYPEKMILPQGLTVEVQPHSQMILLHKNGTSIGYELFNKENSDLRCVDMEVNSAHRRNGFGGLLHSISVMLMKANRVNRVHLESLPQAVKTHYDNGFRCASRSLFQAKTNMKSIISSKTPFATMKSQAQDILRRLDAEGDDILKAADTLYDNYLKLVFDNNISIYDACVPETLYMELTSSNAKNNSAMFNSILKNFGIAYKI